jgi:hypothetical protein
MFFATAGFAQDAGVTMNNSGTTSTKKVKSNKSKKHKKNPRKTIPKNNN